MNINATLFAQVIIFLILALVTMKFIWPPLMTAIDERNKKIADGLEAAEKGRKMLIDAENEAENILQEAHLSVQKKIAAAEQQAKISAEEILTKARSQANEFVSRAELEVENKMRLARDALRADLAKFVIYGAEKILSREIDQSNHLSILAQLKNEL